MPNVKVIPVGDRRTLKRFVRFPRSIYPPSSLWVSPLDWERLRFFDRNRNPFYKHADMQLFLAVDSSGRDVGRIAAVDNPRHNEFQGTHLGFFGFFDAVDDASVAGALFAAAEGWLRQKGFPTAHGPVNPSTNHECGLLVKGFDRPPRVMMTYNHPYYVQLFEGAGYRGVHDLVAFEYDVTGVAPDRLQRAVDLLERRHAFGFRPMDVSRLDEEVERAKIVWNEGWAENYGFVPLTDDEARWLAKEMRPFLAPDMCGFAEVRGEIAGVMILLPDLNQALKPLRGKLFPLGWLKFMRGLKRVDAMRAAIMGVRPGFRKIGIDYAFYNEGLKAAHARHYKTIELSWILADNLELVHALQNLDARETKRYRLYEKSLTDS